MSALITGFQTGSKPWITPSCQFLTSNDSVWPLPGGNDGRGHWNGLLQGFAPLPLGMTFHAQIVSGSLTGGVALSDASTLSVPPVGPVPITVVRIAHGSARTSTTGTVSSVVPVTEFF